ncbi:MAG: acetate--CoA ligase [Sterolibacteriaceae bacterium]|nr:acetate--CoA ligase [Sterolibacteriaceae bacterium]MBK9085997.1 acetate--CoA ligase [Sterolibacteriaceae bacterium]
MRPPVIRKSPQDLRVPPHLADWQGERARFAWSDVRKELTGAAQGGLNIGRLAVDRHLATAVRERVAFRFIGRNDSRRDVTYADLARQTNRFANVLKRLGVGRGERLFILAGRVPELYTAAIGALKNGTVVAPLFSAFGPEPIRTRMAIGEGRVLLTSESLFRRKVAGILGQLPALEHILLIGDDGGRTDVPGTLDLATLMEQAADDFEAVPTSGEDMALLHFTSGTSGAPKAAVHVHAAAIAHYATSKYALDLHGQDMFWCTADPGWVTGTSYGIIAPLLHGVTSLVDEADFDAERWYRLLQEHRVSVWYTAPTAIRMLMKGGAELARKYCFPDLRLVASVGEPLNPEAVWWGIEVLGLPIHDNWWQTETGAIMIANTVAMDIKPGSMGKPLPGVDASLVRRREGGGVERLDAADAEGELALRAGWPSMFRGYLGQEDRYPKCFAGDYYLTGDLARRDADGYYWFVGRADDLIKSAGHLIGPFEVENVLMEHPAVAEAGVIGKPDPLVGEVVKAFVSLKPGFGASEPLRMDLLGHARKRLGAAVAPKEIAFLATLPRTRSGKIMRRLLKARELGLPEGDTSTLEGPA